jgi:hypothetical protein
MVLRSVKKADTRMSVEAALQKIDADCTAIRTRLNLPLTLRGKDFAAIEKDAMAFDVWGKGGYADYEIGHRFIVDHVVMVVKNQLDLNKEEEVNLRAVLGRIYYNPPIREYKRQKIAARALISMGARGQEIFDQVKGQVNCFRQLYFDKDDRTQTDIFANPFATLCVIEYNREATSFRSIIDGFDSVVSFITRRNEESTSFYR